MKTKLNILIPALILGLIFTSCSSDDDAVVDTESPAITINEPHDEEAVAPGGEIPFDAVFTDNVELANYKIEIHNSFDGHTHSATKQAAGQDNPWSFSQVYNIPAGQKSFNAHEHIPVPAEINGAPVSQGHYHMAVYVTDTSGNESQAFREIHIEEGDHDHDHDH